MLKKYLVRTCIVFYCSALLVGTRSHTPQIVNDAVQFPLDVDKKNMCEKELRKQHIYWFTLTQWRGYYTACAKENSPHFASRIYLYAYALRAENPALSEDFFIFYKKYAEKIHFNLQNARQIIPVQ